MCFRGGGCQQSMVKYHTFNFFLPFPKQCTISIFLIGRLKTFRWIKSTSGGGVGKVQCLCFLYFTKSSIMCFMIYAIIGMVKTNLVHIRGGRGSGEVGLNPLKYFSFFSFPNSVKLMCRTLIFVTF